MERGDSAGDEEYLIDEYSPEFLAMIQPGQSVRTMFDDKTSYELLHIRAIVDDTWIVVRTWGKHKKRWLYRVESLFYLWLYFKDKRLNQVRPR